MVTFLKLITEKMPYCPTLYVSDGGLKSFGGMCSQGISVYSEEEMSPLEEELLNALFEKIRGY